MYKCVVIAIVFLSGSALAQMPAHLTAQDYQRAERFMPYSVESLIDHAAVRPTWLAGDRFFYRDLNASGSEFILVDPAKGSRTSAFDHQKVADALSAATGNAYKASGLPFQSMVYSTDNHYILFQASGKIWKYNLQTAQLSADSAHEMSKNGNTVGAGRGDRGNEVTSPDGRLGVYIKDYNLWVRDMTTKQQKQLTTDGIKDFGYATDNAGWTSSDRPVLLWSPDSKKIATFKQDQRNVSDMYLVTTNVGKPTLKQWKYPLPGDKDIPMIQRVIIDVESPKVIVLQVPADPHRASLGDDISSSGAFDDVNWSEDASKLAFVSTSRDHKEEKVRIADAVTGAVREVFQEVVPTQYESGWGAINWKYLDKTNEFIWFSERDNWGHLYLYDAGTGKVKNQITKGDWLVTRVIKIDDKKRTIYFMANGRQQTNPYFAQFCKIGFDGKHFAVLTPEEGNHQVSMSPSGNYFIDTWSQPNVPATIAMRNTDGKIVVNLEKTDISRLSATGWKAPTPIMLKAHDGKTDIYGLMFMPTNFDSTKKYPVIDYIYPGPPGW